MEGRLKPINNLPSTDSDTVSDVVSETGKQGLINPYKEILKFLDKFEVENPEVDRVSIEDLKEAGLGPMERSIIRTWITSYGVDGQYLMDNFTDDEIKERAGEIKVSIEALRRTAEAEAHKWEMEHSNNLYDRYKLLKGKKKEFTELPTSQVSWASFSSERKILVLAHYIMEALKQEDNYITFVNLPKPLHFYYQGGRGRPKFNERAFKQFIHELGIDPEEPIKGRDLALILLGRFGYTEDSLRGFYEEIVREFIKPSQMRLPPCIEALAFRPLFYDVKRGRIIDEALKILASWFKYYARGYSTGRIKAVKDKRLYLFEFLVTKVFEGLISLDDQAEVIQRFKKFYEEATPFKCRMVHEFENTVKFGEGLTAGGVKICSNKCPFVAPLDRIEEVLATVQEVNLYGADHLEIKIDKDNKFFEEYSPAPTSRSKLVYKFVGFLSVLYGDPLISPEEALEILNALLERARIVQNYVSPLMAVERGFKQIMEILLEDGALPWDLRARDRPFLDNSGKFILVKPGLIASVLPSVEELEGYTSNKLVRALKKLPNSPIKGVKKGVKVKEDSYSEKIVSDDFWMVSVEWLKEHGIEVRVKIPTLEEPKTEEQKEPEEDLKDVGVNLTPLEKLILGAAREPKDLTELIDLGIQAGKSQDEVTLAITELIQSGLLELLDGTKLRRTSRGGAQ